MPFRQLRSQPPKGLRPKDSEVGLDYSRVGRGCEGKGREGSHISLDLLLQYRAEMRVRILLNLKETELLCPLRSNSCFAYTLLSGVH